MGSISCLYLLHIRRTDYLCKLDFVIILQEERFFVINMDQTKFLGFLGLVRGEDGMRW